jgi:hypothetical protein
LRSFFGSGGGTGFTASGAFTTCAGGGVSAFFWGLHHACIEAQLLKDTAKINAININPHLFTTNLLDWLNINYILF